MEEFKRGTGGAMLGGVGRTERGGGGCRGRRQPHLSLYLFPPKKRKKKGFLKERVPADMKTDGGMGVMGWRRIPRQRAPMSRG